MIKTTMSTQFLKFNILTAYLEKQKISLAVKYYHGRYVSSYKSIIFAAAIFIKSNLC
jgi:hypothetical protein